MARPRAETDGHLRVSLWFGGYAVLFSLVFALRLEALQPNWLLLIPLMAIPFTFSVRAFKDLSRAQVRTTPEWLGQIGAAAGGLLTGGVTIYVGIRYGGDAAMRVLEAYVMPMLVPYSAFVAALALYVERKHKVLVYVGNQGWLYVRVPSNNTVHRTREEAPRAGDCER